MWAKNARLLASRAILSRRSPAAPYLSRSNNESLGSVPIRDYSETCIRFKKRYDEEAEERMERIIIPGQPEIQTINRGDWTDEDIERIIEEQEKTIKEEEDAKVVKNWKPGMRKRPLVMSYHLEDFEYELEPEKYGVPWTNRDKRCGALAIKVGMMPVFDDWGIRNPCTVLYMDKNIVLGHKTMERNGYMATQVAAGERKRKNVGKCVLGQYKGKLFPEEDKDTPPPWMVREFRISDPKWFIPENTQIHAMHFVPGQNVDVAGISKGKGFQGPMKRWGFSGMPASHGVSKAHRAHGSTGACQDPGKVFKGKKMAGRMGGGRVTVMNKRIIKIDRGRNLLYILGSIPGNKGAWVEIKDAVRKPLWKTEHVIDKVDRPPLPTYATDPTIDGSGEPGHEVFMPLPERDPLSFKEDDAA
jgi:large subunit ribosomal protein L3